MLTVGSLFAGIGGIDLGLERAGMQVRWQVEIEDFPTRVLERYWPSVTRHRDVRQVGKHNLEPVDLICGGFPCQDLSVAGRRAGLAGERSGLFFEFMRVVAELAPRWVLIENVPGLLSSNGGRDMGTVLGALAELGYGYAYRVLDAQYFGVAQRRRRVFIVGCLGDAASAVQVLFEPESCERNTPPRRAAGRVAAALPASGAGTSRTGNERTEVSFLVAQTFLGKANSSHDHTRETYIPILEVGARTNPDGQRDGMGIGQAGDPMFTLQASKVHGIAHIPVGFHGSPNAAHTLRAEASRADMPSDSTYVVTFSDPRQHDERHGGMVRDKPCLNAGNNNLLHVAPTLSTKNEVASSSTQRQRWMEQSAAMFGAVRRLTPRECERLQGFPDDWTLIDGDKTPDTPRYRALGNAVAVPVAEWIGRRIVEVEKRRRSRSRQTG